MKAAFKATSPRMFRIRFAWLIGIGREHSILNKKGTTITEVVSLYLPFCVITAIHHFKRIETTN